MERPPTEPKLRPATRAPRKHTGQLPDPRWSPPEVLLGASPGPPAEVWALGLFAFRLTTGGEFFRAAEGTVVEYQSLVAEVLTGARPLASVRAAQLGAAGRLPRGFDAWFARCLAPEPEDRYPSAAEAMQAFVERVGPWPTPKRAALPVHVPPTRPPRAPSARTASMAPVLPARRRFSGFALQSFLLGAVLAWFGMFVVVGAALSTAELLRWLLG